MQNSESFFDVLVHRLKEHASILEVAAQHVATIHSEAGQPQATGCGSLVAITAQRSEMAIPEVCHQYRPDSETSAFPIKFECVCRSLNLHPHHRCGSHPLHLHLHPHPLHVTSHLATHHDHSNMH